MSASIFDILMAVAIGALAGTGIGLFIGFVTKQQRSEWSAMTRKQKIINIVLVLFFSVACIAGLAWYMFFRT
jgi:NADH:ubiquinone oxidoreductase subunit 5 (subunit L)/multisubunit Na+/H+ antiporter MnhA subunit